VERKVGCGRWIRVARGVYITNYRGHSKFLSGKGEGGLFHEQQNGGGGGHLFLLKEEQTPNIIVCECIKLQRESVN
jgi:hypothetical protein